jgi:hypothetical protein
MTLTPKQFMIDFGLKLIKPSTKETWMDGIVMAFSYSLGMCHSKNPSNLPTNSRSQEACYR